MKSAPVARPRSLITGERMEKIDWGPNWEEILGGEFAKRSQDSNFEGVQKEIYGEFENTFMMYLPRLCEHCLNPTCVACCPSGSIYKREEDGIVLIDQDKCRGWRMCVSGCPYKKIYYNWSTGKAEKCIFCYPRIEAGQPTVCSETCVGRIRYLGVLLYDADRIEAAASVEDPKALYDAQLGIFLDPHSTGSAGAGRARRRARGVAQGGKGIAGLQDGGGLEGRAAAAPRIPHAADGLVRAAALADPGGRERRRHRHVRRAARRALAAHPGRVSRQPADRRRRAAGGDRARADAGDARLHARPPRRAARERHGARSRSGLTAAQVEEMYRYMAIANYEDRFVIPTTHREYAENAYDMRGGCGFSFGNGCSDGASAPSLFGGKKRKAIPIKQVA